MSRDRTSRQDQVHQRRISALKSEVVGNVTRLGAEHDDVSVRESVGNVAAVDHPATLAQTTVADVAIAAANVVDEFGKAAPGFVFPVAGSSFLSRRPSADSQESLSVNITRGRNTRWE